MRFILGLFSPFIIMQEKLKEFYKIRPNVLAMGKKILLDSPGISCIDQIYGVGKNGTKRNEEEVCL